MVRLHLDTNRDPIEDLEEAIELLQAAVTRRQAEAAVETRAEEPSAQEIVEETALDAGFLEIKVETVKEKSTEEQAPDEPITESELTSMFDKEPERTEEQGPSGDPFIEIVEFDDD